MLNNNEKFKKNMQPSFYGYCTSCLCPCSAPPCNTQWDNNNYWDTDSAGTGATGRNHQVM